MGNWRLAKMYKTCVSEYVELNNLYKEKLDEI